MTHILIELAKALACVVCLITVLAIVAGWVDQQIAERSPDRKPSNWRDIS